MNILCETQPHIAARKEHNHLALLSEGNPGLINTRGPRGSDPRETSETYKRELFRLGRYRVAVCRDGLQWLYQRRRPAFKAGGVAWNTLGYCANKTQLMRLHRTHSGSEAQAISDLPFHFKRGAQK